jgi:hypothetical protein
VVLSKAEVVIDLARRAMSAGTMLQAHDTALVSLANELPAGHSEDVDQVKFELYELRAMIARDSLDIRAASHYADIARSIAFARRDWPAMCRLSLIKATAALVVNDASLAQVWITEALYALKKLPPIARGSLAIEIRGSITHRLVLLGHAERAEQIYRRYIIPQSLLIEPPNLISARFSTLARIHMWNGRKPTRDTENVLAGAEEWYKQEYSNLREVQWRVALAEFLASSGDAQAAASEARQVQELIRIGQFRHQGAEALMRSFGLSSNLSVDPVGGTEPNRPDESTDRNPPNVFNTYIYGGLGNYAIGSSHIYQKAATVGPGDFGGLLAVLSELGVEKVDLDSLAAILEQDHGEAGDGQPKALGSRTSSWLKRMSFRVGSVASQIGIGAAGAVAAQAIFSYLGLH